MEDAEKQHSKQNYDWLKGYRWVKGQSGNPGGRPKGKSLKTFAREYLESLPDEEKVAYLATLPAEVVWKMAEGNPESNLDLDVKVEITDLTDDQLNRIITKRATGKTLDSSESGT